jgi:hypothetical protein
MGGVAECLSCLILTGAVEWQMSLCRKFAMHWLAVTQARTAERLAAQQLLLRKDGRPADYRARKRRDQLATRARELRAKPPLFSPHGGAPGAKARYPAMVAFERLEKISRYEASSHRPGFGEARLRSQTYSLMKKQVCERWRTRAKSYSCACARARAQY